MFRWLTWSGNLTLRNIEAALKDSGANPTRQARLSPGCLIKALLVFEPRTDLFLSILEGPVFFNAFEIMQAARPLIQALIGLSAVQDRALPATAFVTNTSEPLHDLTPTSDALQTREEQLTASIADQQVALEKALIMILMKLHTFPYIKISQAFEQVLTRMELGLILQLLRRNLATGGWTSWQLDEHLTMNESSRREEGDAYLIGNLLGCALDSIGAADWIHTSFKVDGFMEPNNLVTALKLEISAALEVVEEATFAKGLLREMLHYARQETATASNNNGKHGMASDIIVLKGETTGQQMLPLGSRPETDVPTTKMAAGGEVQKRTPRDIGRLKNMRVGKYSRERIVI